MKRIFWWGLLLLILCGLTWKLTHHQASDGSQGGKGGKSGHLAIPVTMMSAKTQNFPIYLDGLGTVQAYNSALVNARVSGLIQEIRFQEGQEVKQGDVLVVIDPRTYQAQYNQTVSKTAQDTAQLESAKITLARDLGLLEKNVLDHQTFDTQKYLVDQLQATVQSDQANQEFAKSQLDWTQVTAPISGRTGVRQVDVGNQVSAGGGNNAGAPSTIVVINQIQPIYVSFTLPQQDLSQIRESLLAQKILKVVALDRNNQTTLATGTLSVIDNQIDPATATVKLKALFANEDERLWPGQFVNVRLLVAEHADAVVVPTQAIQLGPDGSYVYVVVGENKVKICPVVAGPSEGGMTLVESGLAKGEMVVTDGQYRLQPDSEVQAAPGKTTDLFEKSSSKNQ